MELSKEELLKKGMKALGWEAIQEAIASFASLEKGKEEARKILPSSVKEKVLRLQEETTQILRFFQKGFSLPPFPPADLTTLVENSCKGILCPPPALRQLSLFMEACSKTGRLLRGEKESCPLLFEVAPFSDLGEVKRAIDRGISEKGEIREDASSHLHSLHEKYRILQSRALRKLEKYLQSTQYRSAIQESYHTIREGRCVIPVKAEMKNKVNGIVHDSSASGLTLFIEPGDMVELNNALRMTDLEIEREKERILMELTEKVGEESRTLLDNIHHAFHLDLISARGKLALSMKATRPRLNEEGKILIREGRHPLLVLEDREVVPNTIELGGEKRALVISGPNTGGKTVVLKTVGLLSLMFRCGLHLPLAEESEIPLFKEIYADIGDEQDISSTLSTFSGHVLNIIGILRHAAPSSLILLDELMASTDPTEGSVLAETVLIELIEKGNTVSLTTHYPSLKNKALVDSRMEVCSMDFNHETLTPTYRLLPNLPGSSLALTVAARLGMEHSVVERARELLTPEQESLEELSQKLDQLRGNLERELEQARQAKSEAESFSAQAKKSAENLAREEKEFSRSRKRQLREELAGMRKEFKDLLEESRKDQAPSSLKKVRRFMGEVESQALTPPPDMDLRSPDNLKKGDPVYILSLELAGTLAEEIEGKKRVRVNTANRDIVVSLEQLRGLPSSPSIKKVHRQNRKTPLPIKAHSAAPPGKLEGGMATKEYDLRGKRGEEAIEELIRFLDESILSEDRHLRIIHGHGTGALKKMVREYLKSSPYVKSFRRGEQREGGDGVTVVELKG